jgi:hypothetical protein
VGSAGASGTAATGTAGASAASVAGPSAAPGTHGSPTAQGAASPGVVGTGSANGVSAAGTGIGGVAGSVGVGLSAAQQAEACRQAPSDDGACAAARGYSMEAIYFDPRRYSSQADCLTAAFGAHLPLDMCR